MTTDKHKVLQILVNLLQNARRACEESGRDKRRVSVEIRRVDEDRLRVSVSDNGVGTGATFALELPVEPPTPRQVLTPKAENVAESLASSDA